LQELIAIFCVNARAIITECTRENFYSLTHVHAIGKLKAALMTLVITSEKNGS